MVRGAFNSYEHQHFLEPVGQRTLMKDLMVAQSPLGPLGLIADRLFVERILTRLLKSRNEVLKRAAETNEWRQYLLPQNPT
jgi:ligand-binding SRPBCC domain-containing protein